MTEPNVGRCGGSAPGLLVGPPLCCGLPAGHAGWHRDDSGAEWTPEPATTGQIRERVARAIHNRHHGAHINSALAEALWEDDDVRGHSLALADVAIAALPAAVREAT